MQKIRGLVLPVLLMLFVFSSLLYTGCKDKCGSTTCSNGGTCVNNVCVCPTGYYGTGCQNSYSSPFIGTYTCTKSCNPATTGGTWSSAITVASTNGGNTIYIANFGGSSPAITAVATVDSTIDSIATITIDPATSSNISGTGQLRLTHDSTIITMHYAIASGGGTSGFTCNMTMIKQ